MIGRRLTKRIVDELEPRDTEYTVWCGKLRGYGCRVRPSGHKSFIAQYRVGGRNTTTRKRTIGSYDKITVEQAREEAVKILAKAELGEDESRERARARNEMNMSGLLDEYLRLGVDHKKPSTLVSDRSRIEAHIRPLLGRKRISEITSVDISQFLRDVATGKARRNVKTGKHGRSIVRGGKGAATRTVRLLSGVCTYAQNQGYLKQNPCRGAQLYRDKRSERFLSNQEFGRLGGALRVAETAGIPRKLSAGKPEGPAEVFSPHVIAAFRLLMFTGCRLREVLNLRWENVDFERGVLNLPDSKTGRKKILVPAPVIQILMSLERRGDYVIAGKDPSRPRADLQRPWKRITQHAQLGPLRIHDLRHSYASVGAAGGMGLIALGKLLGHSSPSTTQRYAHLADDPLRLASEHIATVIANAAAVSDSSHTPKKSALRDGPDAADK
jgi:integrase